MTKSNLCLFSAGFALLLGIPLPAHAAVPSMEVTVSDAAGRIAFTGVTNADAVFSSANLPAGHYVVQFKTRSAAARGNQYLAVVSAGAKKVIATDVAGETFMRGGVAMKVNVERGAKISGQVADEQQMAGSSSNHKVIRGQRFVWITQELGTNIKGRWVEESLAPAFSGKRISLESIRKLQDRAGEGSMVSSRAENLGR